MTNVLHYGDNLEVLPSIASDSVDLVYLDPPFNSNRSYNVIFRSERGEEARAQTQAFTDTWVWKPESDAIFDNLQASAPTPVADAVVGIRRLIGDSDVMAYLLMMTPRLLELRRVLKPTGSVYLHCDPTASHYLKLIMDSVFGAGNFRNEIIWRRTGAHTTPRRFETIHDTIFFYSKTNTYYFRSIVRPYTKKHVEARYIKDSEGRLKFITGGNILTGPGATEGESGMPWRGFDPSKSGRHWAIPGYLASQMPAGFANLSVLEKLEALYQASLIEIKENAKWPHPVKFLGPEDGTYIPDIWAYQPGTEGVLYGTDSGIDSDVQWLGPTAPERLGYQTQKPEGLLERIISASCPPTGIVLDPFCGCGTTVAAAQKLGRSWVGIDITYLSIDIIVDRLTYRYGPGIRKTFTIEGKPRDLQGAVALFEKSRFEFERWAVIQVKGRPNEKQVGDRGADGVIPFPLAAKRGVGRVLVSVKGGEQLGPDKVRDLAGTVHSEKAEMGLMITLRSPTSGMQEAAHRAGYYTWPVNGERFPKVQIITVKDILAGKRPLMPPPLRSYLQAESFVGEVPQPDLF